MNNQAERMLSTGWNLVRDAGSAVSDAAVNTGSSLARNLPRVKDVAALSAGAALARRGSRATVTAVRRHPVLSILGAVALAGIGVAVYAAKRRREAAENGLERPASGPRRIKVTNMRGDGSKSRTASGKTGAGKSEQTST